jgi:uncharacterized membrane protein
MGIALIVCIVGAAIYLIANQFEQTADSLVPAPQYVAELAKWAFIIGLAVYLFKG